MKDSGKWAVVFTVLNIILIVTCVVLLLGRDRKAPVISFSENDLMSPFKTRLFRCKRARNR